MEDRIATLRANSGLRYLGKAKDNYIFKGSFYLTNSAKELIESFEVLIRIDKSYPNTFPKVWLCDDKIEKTDSYHIEEDGSVCFDHPYVINSLKSGGLRLFDFVDYYLTKYFSWALVKKHGKAEELEEWAHNNLGTIQVYETLLETTDKETILFFLENYLKEVKIGRNSLCYCGSGRKLKNCHYDQALFLKTTSKTDISRDLILFK